MKRALIACAWLPALLVSILACGGTQVKPDAPAAPAAPAAPTNAATTSSAATQL